MTERRVVVGGVSALSDDGMTFAGHAALVGVKAYIGPKTRGFHEQFAAGAFTKALKGDVRMVFNHDPNLLLGRTSSGTLKLTEDEKGLHAEAQLPDTSLGRDVRTLIQRGDISGQSIQFTVGKDEWTQEPGGHSQLRTIHEVAELIDCGPVVYPAYGGTTASVRSALLTAPAEVRSAVLAIPELRAGADVASMLELVDTTVDALCAMCMAADGAVEALMAAMGMPDMDDGDMPQANSARTGRSVHQLRARLRLAKLAAGGQ